jgi:hypothetical protein
MPNLRFGAGFAEYYEMPQVIKLLGFPARDPSSKYGQLAEVLTGFAHDEPRNGEISDK